MNITSHITQIKLSLTHELVIEIEFNASTAAANGKECSLFPVLE
jgi:hypothetical protein